MFIIFHSKVHMFNPRQLELATLKSSLASFINVVCPYHQRVFTVLLGSLKETKLQPQVYVNQPRDLR